MVRAAYGQWYMLGGSWIRKWAGERTRLSSNGQAAGAFGGEAMGHGKMYVIHIHHVAPH
jgi:hypothetical protein